MAKVTIVPVIDVDVGWVKTPAGAASHASYVDEGVDANNGTSDYVVAPDNNILELLQFGALPAALLATKSIKLRAALHATTNLSSLRAQLHVNGVAKSSITIPIAGSTGIQFSVYEATADDWQAAAGDALEVGFEELAPTVFGVAQDSVSMTAVELFVVYTPKGGIFDPLDDPPSTVFTPIL